MVPQVNFKFAIRGTYRLFTRKYVILFPYKYVKMYKIDEIGYLLFVSNICNLVRKQPYYKIVLLWLGMD